MNTAFKKSIDIKTGDVVMAQLGIPTDSSGYSPSSEVTVLAVKKYCFYSDYLVKVNGQKLLGKAIEVTDHVNDVVLQVDVAIPYGKDGHIKTFDAAVKCLRFDVLQPLKMWFHELVENAEEVPFNKEWCNGTGYFDHAVSGDHAPILKAGEVVKSIDHVKRLIAIMGTDVGNIVVFDRFNDVANNTITKNMPYGLEKLLDISPGALKRRDLELIFGYDGLKNVGQRLSKIKEI